MNNLEFAEQFNKAGININKLFWIAASDNKGDVEDMIQEMDDAQFESVFPDCFRDPQYATAKDDGYIMSLLKKHYKYGFVAEVIMPIPYDFKCNAFGTVVSWSTSPYKGRITYAYAETTDLLFVEVGGIRDRLFEYFVELEKQGQHIG